MGNIIYVTELKVNDEIVYRRESHNPVKSFELRQYIGDSITGQKL